MIVSYTANISNETYNQLLSSFSNEESKTLFIASFKENNNEKLNNNIFAIRILSNSEYDRYLMNNTCNGAINKRSDSVFHFCDRDGASALVWYYTGDKDAHNSKLYNNPNIYRIRTSDIKGAFGHLVFIYELSENNENNNCISRKTKKSVIDIFSQLITVKTNITVLILKLRFKPIKIL